MATATSTEVRNQIVTLVRDFVKREVEPIAQRYDNEDIYPQELIEPMREMGLFGITIPEEYGGLGLDHTTFAIIFEELSRGWMSVSGIIGTHHVLAHIVSNYGTGDQRSNYLPRLASGELRGWPRADRAGSWERRAGRKNDGHQGRRRVRYQRDEDVHHERGVWQRVRCADKDRP